MFGEVPVLPVVVPLGAAVCLLLVWRLRSRGSFSWPRATVALALGVYAAGIVANTVFPIFRDKPARTAEWDTYLALTPVAGYGVADAVTNVVVFTPLGMLVALVLARPSWWRVVAVAAAVSLGIEVTQYVTALTLGGGHVADLNDLLFNVVGGALGHGLLAAVTRVPAVARLVDLFRWR
ncbi:VanZ family protein [Nocardioides oleivorans]|uniref:VanZ family protein n=1 Tax=Nocardioides oleivorans TaxID=273676 RepID=A0A4Q2S0J6_9ACTN|nr:VanZ family protein [Nocardioides oleivorans]RYB95140.1 VanZ family protein [Nocardioides oleivorans]